MLYRLASAPQTLKPQQTAVGSKPLDLKTMQEKNSRPLGSELAKSSSSFSPAVQPPASISSLGIVNLSTATPQQPQTVKAAYQQVLDQLLLKTRKVVNNEGGESTEGASDIGDTGAIAARLLKAYTGHSASRKSVRGEGRGGVAPSQVFKAPTTVK